MKNIFHRLFRARNFKLHWNILIGTFLALIILPLKSVAFTETFYVCQGGNGSLPKLEQCATAWDADDFSNSANWNADDKIDSKIGPNDLIIFLNDGGWITRSQDPVLEIQGSGRPGKPITLQGQSGPLPVIDGQNLHTGIEVYGDDYITIRNLRFTRGNKYCYDSWHQPQNIVIEDCIFDNAVRGANVAFTGDNGIIRRCESYSSHSEHGIYIQEPGTSSITIEYCYIHDNALSGIQFNVEAGYITGSTVRYNWIENNGQQEINELSSNGTVYYGNVLIGDSSKTYHALIIGGDGEGPSAKNIKFYNNSIYGNYETVLAIDAGSTGNDIGNNIVYQTNSSYPLISVSTNSSANFDHNQYFIHNWEGAFEYHAKAHDSLSAWQSVLGGCPASGNDCNSDDSDPKLSNPLSGDLSLRSDSPCIDSAASAIGSTYNYMLDPAISKIDFGPKKNVYRLNQNLYGEGWEIGSFIYVSSGIDITPPAAPTGLRIVK